MKSENYNQLSAAEQERLAILAEECAEVIQIVGKILRHGYESCSPYDSTATTNRQLLQKELGDTEWICGEMMKHNDISRAAIATRSAQKAEKAKPFLHHQPDYGK